MVARRAEQHLLGLERFGMRFGLARMRRLLTAVGNPERSLKFTPRVTIRRGRSAAQAPPTSARPPALAGRAE